MPIFKNFVKNALYKEDFKNFLIPPNIHFASVNYDTGKQVNLGAKNSIVEAYKLKDINKEQNKNLEIQNNYDKLIKFRQFY